MRWKDLCVGAMFAALPFASSCRSLGMSAGTSSRFVTQASGSAPACASPAFAPGPSRAWLSRVVELTAPLAVRKRAPEGPTFLWLLEDNADGGSVPASQRLDSGTMLSVVGLWMLTNEASDHCFVTAVLTPVREDARPALYGLVIAEYLPDGTTVSDHVQDAMRTIEGATPGWSRAQYERTADALAKENNAWQLGEWLDPP